MRQSERDGEDGSYLLDQALESSSIGSAHPAGVLSRTRTRRRCFFRRSCPPFGRVPVLASQYGDPSTIKARERFEQGVEGFVEDGVSVEGRRDERSEVEVVRDPERGGGRDGWNSQDERVEGQQLRAQKCQRVKRLVPNSRKHARLGGKRRESGVEKCPSAGSRTLR